MTTIPLVVSIISLSLCASGFFFLRWYISHRTDASRLLEEYRDEVYRLISEIDAATDRDSRLVEERIKNLRKLLDDTDKRISVYTRELQRSRNSEAIYKNLGRGIREALDSIPAAQTPVAPDASPAESAPSAEPASPEEPASPVRAESPAMPEASPAESPSEETAAAKKTHHAKKTSSEETAELPFDEGKSSQTGSAKKQKKRKTADKHPPAARPEKSGIKMQIAQMALQGLSPSEIASSLKISLAEVDLALKLLNIGNSEQ